ncbi:MAG: MmcQ/YjbR family DNA-binding protein [Lachnospiraceae bacterium]|nr:MmcQ/YjbR family DNA-binding protein [Lachnospiraceae bacterium]
MVSRSDILRYCMEEHGTVSEKPWPEFPTNEVLRQVHGRKWYALIMNISRDKLKVENREEQNKQDDEDLNVDVMNVKCDPEMIPFLLSQKGFAAAYHMNKTHWITIILDGSVADEEIYSLLEQSYDMTLK